MEKIRIISTCSIGGVALYVQQANNSIINDLCNKRYKVKAILESQKTHLQTELIPLNQELKQNEDQIQILTNEIEDEKKKMATFSNVENDENTKFIVALGNTGDGKSTVLNRLLGDVSEDGSEGHFKTSGSHDSATPLLEHHECKICNVKSIVVDTPGCNDTKENEDDLHFNNLEKYLYGCGGVDAFLLVCNGTKTKFDKNFQSMLNQYEEYFGKDFWKHLIIILTRIEGYARSTFENTDGVNEFQKDLKKYFPQCDIDIPVIPVGFDSNQKIFVRNVMIDVLQINNNINQKLVCKKMESPIKSKENERTLLMRRNFNLREQIASKQQDIDNLDLEMGALQDKINVPEKCPLITNINAEL